MRSAILSVLLASATSAALLPRQLGGLLSAVMSKQMSVKIENMKPLIPKEGTQRVKIRYGPYTLKAAGSKERTTNGMSMDPGGSGWNYLAGEDFPRDVTILQTDVNVVFENGSSADVRSGIYNHHIVFFNSDKTSPQMVSCKGKTDAKASTVPMSIFMGRAEDKGPMTWTTLDGNFNSGYYIGKNDKIMFMGDIVNYNKEPVVVYTESEIEYTPGKIAKYHESSQQVLSVGLCEGLGVIVGPPKGEKKFNLKSKELTITRDGFLVNVKGHLHDGGENLLMRLNGKEICNTKAVYGGKEATMAGGQKAGKDWETIDTMTVCQGPIKVVKGDKLELEANYDLNVHPPRMQHGGGMAEEMALVAAVFAGTEDVL